MPDDEHRRLLTLAPRFPQDYEPYGQTEREGPDCSSGCKYARWLKDHDTNTTTEHLSLDWLVCTNPRSHRVGLLTFEHQAGANCFEAEDE
jgi:hypothetical protein